MTTRTYLSDYVIPAAYALLPPRMACPQATAMLLAIAEQESRCECRRQHEHGPARGFWQFELAGVSGVMKHGASARPLAEAVIVLRYPLDLETLHTALEHHDVLAAVFARLLLYTLPADLPARDEASGAWRQYIAAWRPGRPRHETWDRAFTEAWRHISGTPGTAAV